MNGLQKLRKLFVKQLSVGPFPAKDCAKAGIVGKTHGDLVMYLANVAGIAERGERLRELDDPTRRSFKTIVANGWWEKHRETAAKVAASTTPRLYQLISATEEARLLIVNEFNR
jgi:hypothetical protein